MPEAHAAAASGGDRRRRLAVEVTDAAKYLAGKSLDDKVVAETSRLAAAKSAPSADRRGSVEYKQQMARVLTGRALRKAVERAGGR